MNVTSFEGPGPKRSRIEEENMIQPRKVLFAATPFAADNNDQEIYQENISQTFDWNSHSGSIHRLSSESNGPLHQILRMLPGVRDKIKLELVCKSFRELARKFCWDDVQELRIDVRTRRYLQSGDKPVQTTYPTTKTYSYFRTNGLLFQDRTMKNSIRGLLLLLQRCKKKSLKQLCLASYRPYEPDSPDHADSYLPKEAEMRIFSALTKFRFQCEMLRIKNLEIGKESGVPNFILKQQQSLKYLIFESTEISDTELLCCSIAQCPKVEEISLIDFEEDLASDVALPNFTGEGKVSFSHLELKKALQGRSMKKITIENALLHLTTDQIATIFGSLKSLNALRVGPGCFDLDWPKLFRPESCRNVLRHLKVCQWKFYGCTYYRDGSDGFSPFVELLPVLPDICPLLEKLEVSQYWYFDHMAEYNAFVEQEAKGLAKMIKTFLENYEDSATWKTLLIRWVRGIEFGFWDYDFSEDHQSDLMGLLLKNVQKIVNLDDLSVKIRDRERSHTENLQVSLGEATVKFSVENSGY